MTQQQCAAVVSALVLADYFPSASKDAGGDYQVTLTLDAGVDASTIAGFATQQGVGSLIQNIVFK